MNAKNLKKIAKTVFAGLLIVALTGLASCKKTEEPTPTPEPQPAKYTIKGTVTNQETGALLSGVLVTMRTVVDGPALTQTTTTTGAFEFANLAVAGKYILTFSKANFFNATSSLEFAAAGPNHTVVYTITAAMTPYVPGVTPLNPILGGVISVTGGLTTTITIPASTTVKDKLGATVTGSINITAITTSDIFIPGGNNYPGLIVLRFEPSGYQFSNPMPLLVRNPVTGYRFSKMLLEFYNETTNQWEVQTQPITYVSSTNDYSTTISHFSIYKEAIESTVEEQTPVNVSIEVTDSVIRNFSLTNLSVNKIRLKRYSGYKLDKPILTTLSDAGITGTDATTLETLLTNVIKDYNGGSAPVSQFSIVNDEVPVNRTIIPKYKLVTSGEQKIINKKITILLTKISDSSSKSIIINTSAADDVTLFMRDLVFDARDHAMGGGGTN